MLCAVKTVCVLTSGERLLMPMLQHMHSRRSYHGCHDPWGCQAVLLISCAAASLCPAGCRVRNRFEQSHTWTEDGVEDAYRDGLGENSAVVRTPGQF
jgi:hypothetical protein